MELQYEQEHAEFVEKQLIAYIGNKRRLLPLILDALKKCEVSNPNEATFYDPFAGTGVVSRLAKSLGFQVFCNDWEPYAYIINRLFIETNATELETFFKDQGGLDGILDVLNALDEPTEKDRYISKYYCPQKTQDPDIENERLFYTQETGSRIDAIRAMIAQLYENENTASKQHKKEKEILLALLLYETATRANTSGVFKGFHRGFGGTGQDALQRILKPLQLCKPTLIDNFKRHKVFQADANQLTPKLAQLLEVDIAYVDPPYNQHQYGSNYHLLNTVALNDKPEVNPTILVDGKKTNKSAIRKDWVKTKSNYCYKHSAVESFRNLIQSLRAHYILVSYSTDGIIDFDTMLSILSEKGKLDIVISEYTKYRGGKQALTTQANNLEWVLIVDTHSPAGANNIQYIKQRLCEHEFNLVLKKAVNTYTLLKNGYKTLLEDFPKSNYVKAYGKYAMHVSIINTIHIESCVIKGTGASSNETYDFSELPYKTQQAIINDVSQATEVDKDFELQLLLKAMLHYSESDTGNPASILPLMRKIPVLYKKYNNRKALVQSLQMSQQICTTIQSMQHKNHELFQEQPFNKQVQRIRDLLERKLEFVPQEPSQQWRDERQKSEALYKEVFASL